MKTEQLVHGDYVAAMFSYDFVEGGFDLDEVERIRCGVFEEWTSAVARSGVFSDKEVAGVVEAWRRDPKLLLDALLRDADEVTHRRYESAWDALDRAADPLDAAVVGSASILV
ncbi:hypothetical protein [Rhodococcus sp. UNC363MFTsu5.1]|uniref:hypothetical protein n=1 Tax=Rhodococcus sp. UNC363MFTsu5.1 TaxID=1449069 RepID=UPI00048222A0|nr:hypothetical protein [Rhodococcus sp. UNC363MFTsu5.1]